MPAILKPLLSFLLVQLLYINSCQAAVNEFARIDSAAVHTGYYSMDILSAKLTAPYHTDAQKIRSIFRWITAHISYDIEEYLHPNYKPKTFSYTSRADSEAKTRQCNLEYAESVIKKRKGICEGYASLFYHLCLKAGIKSEIIRGQARNGLLSAANENDVNHAWNAVSCNGQWKLLDACWAAGYCKDNRTFVKQYNDYYYFTAPELFVLNHYPTNTNWQLSKQQMSFSVFSKLPDILFDRANRRIRSFAPLSGTIDVHATDSIRFTIDLGEAEIKEVMRTSRVIEMDAAGNYIKRPKDTVKQNKFYQNGNLLTYVYYPWNADVAALYLEHKGVYMVAYSVKNTNRQ
jgi:hypothetical protein